MKGKKTDFTDADCGIARSLGVIGDWWSLLIVREAFRGVQRFNEFHKSLGIAKNILSARLKKLVDEGILRIEEDEPSSGRSRYVLTEKGERLYVVLIALWQWGEADCSDEVALSRTMFDAVTGKPLARLEVKGEDGRVVGAREFMPAPRPGTA
ncbi:helix-turn-helix transcriptional regulator [Methylobacterium sp. C25]|nr:helix-turn-helix transcriptional regulator [Methylobacterium sp. C25]